MNPATLILVYSLYGCDPAQPAPQGMFYAPVCTVQADYNTEQGCLQAEVTAMGQDKSVRKNSYYCTEREVPKPKSGN